MKAPSFFIPLFEGGKISRLKIQREAKKIDGSFTLYAE